MLEQIINELAVKISKKRGFHTPYHLIIKPELPPDGKGRERVLLIQAGNPPTIAISRIYIEACMANQSKVGLGLRDALERALEYVPRMCHTLSIVPLADMIAMRKDSRKWAKANIPGFRTMLDDRHFEIEYSVTIKDKITQTSITRNGKDLNNLITRTKYELSRMILENEDMDDYRDIMESIELAKQKPVNPNEISISRVNETGTTTSLEY